MAARSLPVCRLNHVLLQRTRHLSTTKALLSAPPPSKVLPPPPPQRWLTKKVKESPTALKIFIKVAHALGYGSPRQLSARRALHLYKELCAVRADDERDFWLNQCHLPPTFQSWFTITNLHVWLLTVRLRALPSPHGTDHVQALIDHFFLDVEDRIRAVLQPGLLPFSPLSSPSPLPSPTSSPSTPTSSSLTAFYPTPPPATTPSAVKRERLARAPERVVNQQMKIFREQWAGMSLSFDLGLVKGDTEMAAAVWRNLLGARGARGILFDEPSSPSSSSPASASTSYYRRSINLVGGSSSPIRATDSQGLLLSEAQDDNSGVHDFSPGADSDKYVTYPEVMERVIGYVRREVVRMESVEDVDVMGVRRTGREGEGVDALKFGKI